MRGGLATAALLAALLLLGAPAHAAGAHAADAAPSLADWLTRLKVEPKDIAALEAAGCGSLQKLASLPKPEPVLKPEPAGASPVTHAGSSGRRLPASHSTRFPS